MSLFTVIVGRKGALLYIHCTVLLVLCRARYGVPGVHPLYPSLSLFFCHSVPFLLQSCCTFFNSLVPICLLFYVLAQPYFTPAAWSTANFLPFSSTVLWSIYVLWRCNVVMRHSFIMVMSSVKLQLWWWSFFMKCSYLLEITDQKLERLLIVLNF